MFDCFSVLYELKEGNFHPRRWEILHCSLGYKATEQDGNVKCIQTDKEREYMEWEKIYMRFPLTQGKRIGWEIYVIAEKFGFLFMFKCSI